MTARHALSVLAFSLAAMPALATEVLPFDPAGTQKLVNQPGGCTQLELLAGLNGSCGTTTVAEQARIVLDLYSD